MELFQRKVGGCHEKQFAIIGMGRFGLSVATALTRLGYEVLAIDEDEGHIQEASAIVTHAVEADTTEEEALRALGIRNFDVVVVAIGENIQASILTTLILKDIGVKTSSLKRRTNCRARCCATSAPTRSYSRNGIWGCGSRII